MPRTTTRKAPKPKVYREEWYVPQPGQRSIKALLREMDSLCASLRPLSETPDDLLSLAHAEVMVRTYTILRGTSSDLPYSDPKRREALAEMVPPVRAWCVLKVEEPGLYPGRPAMTHAPHWDASPPSEGRRSVWPGQAHMTQAAAERWRDFLEDFYYDVHVRDGKVKWVVAEYFARPGDFRNSGQAPGTGYSDRSAWVGTLPMRRWTRSERGTWRRIRNGK